MESLLGLSLVTISMFFSSPQEKLMQHCHALIPTGSDPGFEARIDIVTGSSAIPVGLRTPNAGPLSALLLR